MSKHNQNDSQVAERQPHVEELGESVRRNMTAFAQASFIDRYPDVRDGLKPVARKVIYSMYRLDIRVNGGTKKCATIVGDVIGNYHPHGDVSTYGALVAMAQPFTYNNPIIQGQGNFGNMLGDGAAAYRYTECKFDKYSNMLIKDLNDEVVEFTLNYSRERYEPTVLPAMIPNLLINGNYTIGGAAFNSSIPSHNLTDVCNLVIDYIKNPDMPNEKMGKRLMPDFPSGGVIVNPEDIRRYYTHGESTSIKMIGKYHVDTDERVIHITELPYLVDGNSFKDGLMNQLEKQGKKLKDIGIEMITTDCDDHGMPTMDISISYIKGADPYKLIEYLLDKTRLSASSQLIFTCVIGGKLMVECTIKDMISEWLRFRRSVVRKTLTRDIQSIYREVHILDALIGIYDHLKDIVAFAETASNRDALIEYLISKYRLTILQAQAISGMKIYELSKDSKQTLVDRRSVLSDRMNILRSKLNDNAIDQIIIDEQEQAIKDFGKPRRTEIRYNYIEDNENDDTPGIDTIISLNGGDSISVIMSKFLTLGFNGRSLPKINDPNFRRKLYKYNTKTDELYAVSNFGYMYKIELIKNMMESTTVERAVWTNQNIKISPRVGEEIVELIPIPTKNVENGIGDVVIIRNDNLIKRMNVSNIPLRVNKNGIRFIPMVEGDSGCVVRCTLYTDIDENNYIMYINAKGQYHKYPLKQLSRVGKLGVGVIGSPKSTPINEIITCSPEDLIYQVSSKGKYACKNNSDLPIKKRTVNPGNINDKVVKVVTSMGVVTQHGTLVTNTQGWFRVVDFNSSNVLDLPEEIDATLKL